MKKNKLNVFVSYLLLLLVTIIGLILLIVLISGYGSSIDGAWENLSDCTNNEKLLGTIVN